MYPVSSPPRDDVARVLGVCAHPDDLDFGAGGTIAGWAAAGIEVAYLLITRGDAGGRGIARDEITGLRAGEQRQAAAALGVRRVDFLDGYHDSQLAVTYQLRRDIARVIRRYRPDRVLTTSPVRSWRMRAADHPDHAAAGEATCNAIYPDAANPNVHPELLRDEQLEPWSVPEVWFCAPPEPGHHVDTTATFARKIAALREHASQPPPNDVLADVVRARDETTAAAAGLPGGHTAEAFTVIRRG